MATRARAHCWSCQSRGATHARARSAAPRPHTPHQTTQPLQAALWVKEWHKLGLVVIDEQHK
jgi:hypothetical protein